jgi:hypothetical protein
MATYSSSLYTNKTPEASHGLANNVKVAYASVTCTAAPATTDTINFFYLPAGARVLLATLKASDMDTNGSPALTINVGDAGSATRYFSGSTVGQAGTEAAMTLVGGHDYANTARTLVTGVAGVNAATGAAGTVELMMLYVVEGAAS